MALRLTERETFANVLSSLVQQRCIENRTLKTSRTGLQAKVPVDERPYVRRGLDALVEHGVLNVAGEDIGVTPLGNLFLAYAVRADGKTASRTETPPDEALTRLLAAIDSDSRLSPTRTMDEIRTLPARLEDYRSRKKAGMLNRWTVGFGAAAAVLGVVALFK